MKKLIVIALLICFLAGGLLGYMLGRDRVFEPAPTPEATTEETTEETPEVTPEAAAEPEETDSAAGTLDYDAIYALHDPDEVVMTAYGREITWGEYFYYLFRQAESVESYFNTMAMYGLTYTWSDVAEGEDMTYAELTVDSAENIARSLAATAGFAKENGAELTDEDRASIEEKVLSDITAVVGEGGTREELDAYLEQIHMPIALYDYMNEISALYQSGFVKLYGENGEKLSDEEAMAWLEANDYMSANHILLMTIDASTRESLDEAAKAEKLAKAQEIAAELQAIEDHEALLARFAELKTEYDEDTGKTAYPNGYVFQPGEMVTEFEETVKSQEAYQVSDPVESAYGYHVIMTLPLDPDEVLEYSSAGAAMTARSVAANEAYSEAADAYALTEQAVLAEGFEAPNLLDYLKT